jgi:hypothetical protein
MVPASLSAEADWAALADANFGVRRILEQAGAQEAWPAVEAFLKSGNIKGHWGSFISNFPLFVRRHQEGFNEAPGFRNLLKAVLLHDIVVHCHQLLYNRTQLCYDIDYVENRDDAPPPYHPTKGRAVRSVALMDFALTADGVTRKYTAYSAAILEHWVHLLPLILSALARPGRHVQIVRKDTAPFQQTLHVREAAVDNTFPEGGSQSDVLATFTCAAMGGETSFPTPSIMQQIIAEATLDLYSPDEEDQAMGLVLPLLVPPLQV